MPVDISARDSETGGSDRYHLFTSDVKYDMNHDYYVKYEISFYLSQLSAN